MDFNLIGQLKKKDKVLEQVKELERPFEFLPGFFNSRELDYLKELKDQAYENKENQRFRQGANSAKPSDVMAWPDDELQKRLVEFFQEKFIEGPRKILPAGVKLEFAFHKNYHPYGLHTDAGYDNDEVIFRQGIIPLEWSPVEARSHTVIMKQKCHFSSSFPAKSQYRPEQQGQVDEMKNRWIENFDSQRPMNQADLAKYWGIDPLYAEALQGFEIDYAFEWKLGDTIVWDRGQIHCSSDFDLHGLDFKVGLMWVSSLES